MPGWEGAPGRPSHHRQQCALTRTRPRGMCPAGTGPAAEGGTNGSSQPEWEPTHFGLRAGPLVNLCAAHLLPNHWPNQRDGMQVDQTDLIISLVPHHSLSASAQTTAWPNQSDDAWVGQTGLIISLVPHPGTQTTAACRAGRGLLWTMYSRSAAPPSLHIRSSSSSLSPLSLARSLALWLAGSPNTR